MTQELDYHGAMTSKQGPSVLETTPLVRAKVYVLEEISIVWQYITPIPYYNGQYLEAEECNN